MNPENGGPQIIRPTNGSDSADANTEPTIPSPAAQQPVAGTPDPERPVAPAGIPPAPALGTAYDLAQTSGKSELPPSPATGSSTLPQATPAAASPPVKKRHSKKFWAMIGGVVAAVLIGGGAYAYFGVYMSSGYVWKQSLGDMGKGYDKLVSYLNQESAAHYKGFVEDGSFKVTSGTDSFDGSLDSQSDGINSTLSAKFDLGVTSLDLEERSIKAAGNSEPDVYLKLSGIKSLSNYLFGADLGPQVDGLDGKWIVIDHNLIIDIKNELTKQQKAGSSPQLTWADVDSFLTAASSVNKKYVFTTNSQMAVTKVLKTYGRETVDGHSTYHYKIGFVSAHVKAYVTDMCSALQASELGGYLQQELGRPVGTSSYCKDLEKSAGRIKSSDTVDVWADINSRMVYKVRISSTKNPAQNFVDIGLNYKGGNSYPFFVNGQDKTGSSGSDNYSLTATLNTSDKSVTVALSSGSHDSSGGTTLSGNLSFKPSNASLSLTPPSNAIPISTVLNELGFGSYLSQLQNLGSNAQLGLAKALPPSKFAAEHENVGILGKLLLNLPSVTNIK